jgi:hypothetical protein
VGETIDGSPTEFLVYEEAIARLSEPLNTLTRGGLSEAYAGRTMWEDVSKETFERFVQFAYTGDYSIPATREWDKSPEPQNGESDALHDPSGASTTVESRVEELQIGLGTDKKSKRDKKKGKDIGNMFDDWGASFPQAVAEPKPDFLSIQCPLLAPRNIHLAKCEPAEFEPDRSYSDVFFAHASLYVLGNLWLIYTLKALAIYKLHKTLCIFKLDGKNVADIVDLARYAYREEGQGSGDEIGRLREIVCHYLAVHATVLSAHAVFMDLIEEGGPFARDFVKFAVQRRGVNMSLC